MAIIAGLGEDVIRRRISFPAVSRISRDSGAIIRNRPRESKRQRGRSDPRI